MDDKERELTLIEGGQKTVEDESKKVHPGCKTCTVGAKIIENAPQVESTILSMYRQGASYASISRAIEPLMATWSKADFITTQNLVDHFGADHATEKMRETRVFVEEAKKAGEDVKAIQAFTRYMNQQIADLFYAGDLTPATLTEAVTFLRFSIVVERESSTMIDANALKDQFAFILDAVRKHIPMELWEKVMEEVRTQSRDQELPALEPARALLAPPETSVLDTLEEEVKAETDQPRTRTKSKPEEDEW